MRISVLFLFTFLLLSAPASAQMIKSTSIDSSGMAPFWQIESVLLKDAEPDPGQWNALFDTPAYQILLAGGFSKKLFEQQLRLAFMPSKTKELTEELDNDNDNTAYLYHYLRIRGKEAEMKKQQAQLGKERLIETALTMAKEFLPDSFQYDNSLPPVSFIVYKNATLSAPTGIIIDLLFSVDYKSYLPYLLAHEAYHFYLEKINKYTFPNSHQRDYPILQVLNQLETEGIADQIDKKKFFLNKGLFANYQWAKSYQYYLTNTPKVIQQLDEFFIHLSTSPQINTKIITDIVPMNGHPTGYFMAKAIIDKMGKRELIKQTANPFAFIRLYQQVALKSKKKYPTFSDITMQYLSKLEKKYFPPKTKGSQQPKPTSPKLMWYEKDKVVNNW